jgi:hypothetical protein
MLSFVLLGVDSLKSACPESAHSAVLPTAPSDSLACPELIVKHHPDKNGGEASDLFLAVSEAWQSLSSQASRRRYDAQLANARIATRQGTFTLKS